MFTNDEAKRLDNSNPEFERVGAFETVQTEQAYNGVTIAYEVKADATEGVVAFTAPFPMIVTDITCLTLTGEASNTFQVLNGTTQVCTALVATTAKAITSMAAAIEIAKLTLAKGDTLKVKAAGGNNGAAQRALITFYGVRV